MGARRYRIISTTSPGQPHALPANDPAQRLGNPSFVWRFGQQRRMAIVQRYAVLSGRRVLDLGCGVGEYVRAFERAGALALGCDIELPRLVEARRRGATGLAAAAAESLPYRDGSLDVVVLNEVIEHVRDERATMREVRRVLAPGGVCIVYAPNRLYPFETHGIQLRGRYRFGNFPFVNWLPRRLRDRLVPHARVYGRGDWRRVLDGSGLEIVAHGYVYPGFDNVAARAPRLARLLRAVCYAAESTPLRRFGLSHLLVLRRAAAGTP
ncbi:MAG: class I SAM-dependent methyltransferase [Dehalococcoidia bacterium]|nr:class I SAM-dependent methyltransferase [Dehalococcoidia bacterium]